VLIALALPVFLVAGPPVPSCALAADLGAGLAATSREIEG
jgi:hypothetical protein